MKTLYKFIAIIVLAISASACTRIETGTVGLRIDATKQVEGNELLPGTGFHQTMIGDVLEFPIRDIEVLLQDKKYMTSDNTPLEDFDISVVYSIEPSAVSELYTKKSKSFHRVEGGDVILMRNYMETLMSNASNKTIRNYSALSIADNRQAMETEIGKAIFDQLEKEGLGHAVKISVVSIKSVVPNKEILSAAVAAVRAEADLKRKNTEIQIAEAEAKRMAALANNSTASIALMDAQSRQAIAQGIREGKVRTVVIPFDFKGQVRISD
jgi:regulator of protease activity HflC (stomatin/prohibitin superfamily)